MSRALVRLCEERVSSITSTTLIDPFGELFMPLMGAEEDDTTGGSGGGGSESGSSSGGGSDTEDDDDDDDDDDPDDEPLDGKSAKKLREEAAKRRRKNRELKGRVAELEKQAETAKNAGKSETERLKAELESVNAKLEESQAQLSENNVKTAFLESNKVQWHDARTAMRLLDRDEIDIEDDGTVTGMDDAIKKLADEHPYLVKKSKDDDDTKDGKDKKRKGSSGEGGTKKQKSNDQVDREALKKKYPALN